MSASRSMAARQPMIVWHTRVTGQPATYPPRDRRVLVCFFGKNKVEYARFDESVGRWFTDKGHAFSETNVFQWRVA